VGIEHWILDTAFGFLGRAHMGERLREKKQYIERLVLLYELLASACHGKLSQLCLEYSQQQNKILTKINNSMAFEILR
jgi:hypothetical protein